MTPDTNKTPDYYVVRREPLMEFSSSVKTDFYWQAELEGGDIVLRYGPFGSVGTAYSMKGHVKAALGLPASLCKLVKVTERTHYETEVVSDDS